MLATLIFSILCGNVYVMSKDVPSLYDIAMNTYPAFTRILNQKLLEQERSATWLAKHLGLHPGTVNRWLNQELRPATAEHVVRIADLLCIQETKERQRLLAAAGYAYQEAQPITANPAKAPVELPNLQRNPPNHNLPPQPTTFVGREQELAQLTTQLAQPEARLLTIVGFGGIGKTRLALEIANRWRNDFTDGVWFVSLVGIAAAASQHQLNPLVMSLAHVLSVVFLGQEEPEEQLLRYLQDKEMLLLFDNVEHLLNLSDFFSRLLLKCPQIKLLVTSRERLRLLEEWLFPLGGLTMPSYQEEVAAATLTHYDAVQLFAQRARRVQPTFDLNASIQQVLPICQLVEGIPLGIELAAAWLRQMSLGEIAREIEQNSDFPSSPLRNQPERHHSFRTVFESSWHLLTLDEQEVLMGLSVFRGGFCRPEAEAVTGVTFQTLTGLVDKSFVRLNQSGRYEIHERIRQYAAEKLRAMAGQEEETQERHARTYLQYARSHGNQITRKGEAAALAAITSEIDNIRIAWDYALHQYLLDEIATTQTAMLYYYFSKDWLLEGREHTIRVIAALRVIAANDAPSTEINLYLGQALSFNGYYQLRTGFVAEGKASFDESFSILRPLEHTYPQALALAILLSHCEPLRIGEDVEFVLNDLKKALTLFQQANDKNGQGFAFLVLAITENAVGNYALAEEYCHQSREYFESPTWLGYLCSTLSGCYKARGYFDKAEEAYLETLHLYSESQHIQGISFTNINLGGLCKISRDYDRAVAYFQQGLDMARKVGYRDATAYALLGLTQVMEILGEYANAQEYANALLRLDNYETSRSAEGLTCLGRINLVLEKTLYARSYFCQALKLAESIRAKQFMMQAIIGFAYYFTEINQLPQAIELLYFIKNDPATNYENMQSAEELLTQVVANVPPEVIDLAQRQAQSITLADVTAQLLAEFGDTQLVISAKYP